MRKRFRRGVAALPRHLPIRKAASLLAAVLIACSVLFGAAPAAAATPPNRICSIVLESLQPGADQSRVREQRCSTGEAPALTTAATTLIATLYQDDEYEGNSTRIYGVGGPCDSAGYGVHELNENWNDRITSFKVWNKCTWLRGYINKDYGSSCGQWANGSRNVGTRFNDKISSFWVASVRHTCQ